MNYPLKGATVLVTGGAGLIGSHIVDQLIDEGVAEIRVLDNLIRGCRDNLAAAEARFPIRFLQDDIRDVQAVQQAMAGCDYVFHQAAIRITLCAEQPRECLEVLINGSFNVFEAAVAAGVRKVVYASSASVYGAAEAFPTGELHHPYHNRTLYGAAKVMNEGLARSFHEMYALPAVGLRYFNVYGPRMDLTGAYTEVFIRWLDCAYRHTAPVIHGDGSATMDFIFCEDIARANILALKSPRIDDVYNVASGQETSLLELWEVIRQAAGAEQLSPRFEAPRKTNPVPRRLADTRRARDELGFQATVPLAVGIQRLAAWQKQRLATLRAAS
ncbi:MAG: NAD-dependent epimerase/dehydratase family protein [Planctomycetales bacterium]|nr:NAD-dependent epimerase/dehydratase family protein [Planctomycetales bacterium]